MIQISPQLQIRIKIRQLCERLGYDVYTYLPDETATYPFIHIGEQFKQNNRIHKDSLNGQTQTTVHVWHNNTREEGTLLAIMNDVEQALMREYRIDGENIDTQFIVDNSTGSNLLHGILDVEIKY